MTGSSQPPRLRAVVSAILMGVVGAANVVANDPAPALRLRAITADTQTPWTIELSRWSTDGERAPLLSALSAPPAPPQGPAAPASGGGGRGGRGGRGGGAPATPATRLTAAVKAASTVGFIWGDGPTGYSIKYAWHLTSPDGSRRIVLVTNRRIGLPMGASSDVTAPDAEFTVIEARLDATGTGEAKSSLTSPFFVDPAAPTLALAEYDAAPVLFKVTR